MPPAKNMPKPDMHDWITLHRVRFPTPISAWKQTFPTVDNAAIWRFCPYHTPGVDGLPTRVSDVWGGMAIWSCRSDAEAMIADPKSALPMLDETLEAWHCLALPVAHRGQVKWRDTMESDTAIRPAPKDPGGPLAIVTSAGFDLLKDDFKPRAIRFTAAVADVLDWYGILESNLRRGAFNGGHDGRDGFTLSLWRSDDAMRTAAYHPGQHRDHMDQSRDGAMMDRSSFTRLRVISSHGDWEGDPFSDLD